ncbi:hypothetical protein BLOT_015357 [Blomia tropicalis]|nr:hypothetical protein BLOT_015357 [Blomia tropicalis]
MKPEFSSMMKGERKISTINLPDTFLFLLGHQIYIVSIANSHYHRHRSVWHFYDLFLSSSSLLEKWIELN